MHWNSALLMSLTNAAEKLICLKNKNIKYMTNMYVHVLLWVVAYDAPGKPVFYVYVCMYEYLLHVTGLSSPNVV